MPDLKKLYKEKETKLDLTKYFEEDAYITIKLMPREVLKYCQVLTTKRFDVLIYSEYQKRGGQGEDYISLMQEIDQSEIDKSLKVNQEIELICLQYIDPLKHNFQSEGKEIQINADFWNTFGQITVDQKSLIDFVCEKVIEHNTGFDLGEFVNKRSNG